MRVISGPPDPKPPLSLKKFNDVRNKVCIICANCGIGDYLMLRMMFDDFKRIDPEIELYLASTHLYGLSKALDDHPCIDKCVDVLHHDPDNYGAVYEVSHSVSRYELAVAPRSGEHRSDIYAAACGMSLNTHDMHFVLSDEEVERGKSVLNDFCKSDKPKVAFCPVSAMKNKNLCLTQMRAAIEEMRKQDVCIFGLHTKPIGELEQLGIATLHGIDIRTWMGVVNATDYMVAVDTSNFHLAGGMRKPLVGIFTWADGKVYGKYFDFELVQKHRDNGDWPCGPCYAYDKCPKTKEFIKPCLTELAGEEIADGIKRMFVKWPVNTILNR